MPAAKKLYRDKNNVITALPQEVKVSEKGIGLHLYDAMKLCGTRVAQIDTETDQKETYASLLEKCVRSALYMRDCGITEGVAIAICSHNQGDIVIPYLAGHFLGAVTIGLDPSYLADTELTHLIAEIKPIIKMIFVSEESLRKVKKFLERTNIIVVVFGNSDEGDLELNEDFLQEHYEENTFVPKRPSSLNNTCMILLSSGSTGLPKGVCLNHRTVLTWTAPRPFAYSFNQLLYRSLYWVSTHATTIFAVSAGLCRVLFRRFDPNTIWDQIKEYKPPNMCLLPIKAIAMAKSKPQDIQNPIKRLSIIGATITATQIEFLRNAFPTTDVFQVYGQSEVGGSITEFISANRFHRQMFAEKPGSCGLPHAGFKLKIADLDTGEALGPNQPGELLVKSKTYLMNGYLNHDNSQYFTEDGWFKTGDILYYDNEYCFYYEDRLKECLKFHEHVIRPAYVERVLVTHPAVQEAVAIGVFHRKDGDHLLGLVILNEGCFATPKDLIEFVADRLPDKFHLRDGVKILKEFPRTGTGKVNRYKLKMTYKRKSELG